MNLNYKSAVPLHEQLKNILKYEILQGKYTEKIPSERELMDRFSVSRPTIRQAILALVDEGVLEKRHGIGTFVSMKPVEEWLGNMSTYYEIIENMGMKPGIKFLNYRIASLPRSVGNTLGVDEFYVINRLRLADNIPIVVEEQYYPIEIGSKLVQYNIDDVSTYDVLEKCVGVTLWESEVLITSQMPTKEQAALLQIPQTMSVLAMEKLITDSEGNPIEFENSVIRSDMYAFRFKSSRAKG